MSELQYTKQKRNQGQIKKGCSLKTTDKINATNQWNIVKQSAINTMSSEPRI